MPKISTEPIYIGCEVLVRKGNALLLGLRGKNIYGGGTWGLPGGHLEYSERAIETACREIAEEVGGTAEPKDLRLASIVDTPPNQEIGAQHHVHITFELREPKWEPRVTEPDECDEWRYFPLDDLPSNILPSHRPIIENYLSGRLYQSD